ncbi:hydrolase [Sphingomonas sp. FW199]|uniref:HAD family hydrolase n=1 Tax=Sphingomonas sp. FW199 TaxID=3400217 RepID=UPI003CE9D43A
MAMKLQVRGYELPGLIDRIPDGVTTLSLDCWDTLVWRNTHAPRDVMADLGIAGGLEPRFWAETACRQIVKNAEGRDEIVMPDIYGRMLPNAAPDRIDALIEAELQAEERHVWAFAPTIDLMRAAKARGLRVILVSDMYLTEDQLRRLVAHAAGDDVLALVDRVFVSSAYGTHKAGTLFDIVLDELGLRPDQMFHIGDNPRADYAPAIKRGIHAAHLVQFDKQAEQRLRLESAAATMVDPTMRVSRPILQPHRAAIAMRQETDPAYSLGHDVFGPSLHAFALWLRQEIDEMAARTGKRVKPLFLMRDGFLPWKIFDATFPDYGAQPIETSRFVSMRAGIHDDASIDTYVHEWLNRIPPEAVARNLLLFDNEHRSFTKLVKGVDPRPAFVEAIRNPALRRKILTRTHKFADKLIAHLARAGVEHGDAVMMIDVGYNGTVQNILTPMLTSRMGLTIAGRYLFMREEQLTGYDKRGMVDIRNYDFRLVQALGTCVAVAEQLCNVAQGSTIDYQADGTPIREKADIKGQQNATRDAVQAGALAFAHAANQSLGQRAPAASDTVDARTRMAAAAMTRLFFMPTSEEAKLFESFDQDVNLGTNQMLKFVDRTHAETGLRRRGLSYINETSRMYIPGELQSFGLPLNLSLFAASRFALDIRNSDFEVGGVDIPVIMTSADGQLVMPFTARPTADGWYRIAVPIGAGKFSPAIQLGAIAEWVQIEDASWHRVSDFDDNGLPKGAPATTITEGMGEMDDDLYRCTPDAFLLAPAPAIKEPLVLTVIFRPVKWRDTAAREQATLAA